MFNPFLSGMKSISFCTKKPVHITFVSVEGACTGCSELYHVCQLSRKCPNYPAESPGSPANTRVSGKKEYPAVAYKQYFYQSEILLLSAPIFRLMPRFAAIHRPQGAPARPRKLLLSGLRMIHGWPEETKNLKSLSISMVSNMETVYPVYQMRGSRTGSSVSS